MTIKRRRVTVSADSTPSLGLGAKFAKLVRVDVLSSADVTTAVTITDADNVTVFTLASGDHTTAKRQYIFPPLANCKDTAGGAVSGTDTSEGRELIVRGPLAVAISGISSGTVTVDCFVDVDRLS